MVETIVIVYRGTRFTRYPNSKNRSDRVYYAGHVKVNGKWIRKRLHVYKYECEVGPVPKGYHVHHADNDTENNETSNFECKTPSQHLSDHGKNLSEERKELMRINLRDNAQPKASEWHKSEVGIEWHRQNAIKQGFGNLTYGKYNCDVCNTEFIKTQDFQRFCSNKCKSKFRIKLGLDNEVRVCAICLSNFTINKYTKTKTCSKICSTQLRKIM